MASCRPCSRCCATLPRQRDAGKEAGQRRRADAHGLKRARVHDALSTPLTHPSPRIYEMAERDGCKNAQARDAVPPYGEGLGTGQELRPGEETGWCGEVRHAGECGEQGGGCWLHGRAPSSRVAAVTPTRAAGMRRPARANQRECNWIDLACQQKHESR
jgi:hypothetical protein